MRKRDQENNREWRKKRYDELKKLGLCICGANRPAMPGRTRCERCTAMLSAAAKKRNDKLRKAGLCTSCKKPTGEGKYCRPCLTRKSELLQEDRKKAMDAYGGPICACCGETELVFLCIDHIENDGSSHRKTFKGSIYRWLRKNKYPPGFQVLCHNCNWGKSHNGGICPHDAKKSKFF